MFVRYKFIVFSIFILVSAIVVNCIPQRINAATSCCYGHGGNYACNYQTGQLYCRDGSVSTQCSCQIEATPTPSPTPTPIPSPTQAQQYCAQNASVDTNTNECICNSGYVASNDTCITDTEYCWNQYGGNSVYNSSNQSCACNQGYVWNSNNSSCISFNTYCQNTVGSDSYYNNSNNSCSCDQGYTIENNQCQLITTQTPNVITQSSKPLVPNLPIEPTIAKEFPVATGIPVKKNTANKVKAKNLTALNLKKFTPPAESSKNNISNFFLSIWNFIKNIFVHSAEKSSNQQSLQNYGINTSNYTLPDTVNKSIK